MTDRLRDTPIKQKLMIVTVLVTTTALLTAGIIIFLSDALLFHRRLQRDLEALAQITTDDTTAAVAFDDPQSASEALAALKARSHLISACIYRADGSMLASYVRPGATFGCEPAESPTRIGLMRRTLTISRPVLLKNRRIATLVILYDGGEIFERMRLYGAIVLLVLLVSSFLSFAISSSLRDLIARPIEELARASSAVSKTRDYSVRAQKLSGDELGTLVDAFNEMLAGIQSREIELRRTLAELQESNENLARSNADLERFAFVTSHDLQEPLRMMSVFSQLLARKHSDKLDSEAAGFLEHIVGGAKRMRELLADLLEYTQLSFAPDIPMGVVDLNVVLDRSLDNLAQAIKASGAVITVEHLPKVAAFEAHLIPLFQNLIGNAIKYRSNRDPRISVAVRDVGERFRFEVADNGIGIAPEYRTKIFLAFQRLHGKEIPGTGIGLAICHRIVERYGGRIWVESESGQGSTFIFTLPKVPALEGELRNG